MTYVITKSELTQRLSTLIGALQTTLGPSVSLPGRPHSFTVSTTASLLPKLQLPKFSGKQTEWDSFKAVFCSMVKDEPSLPPTLKLQHLLAALEAEAARRVRNLEISRPNFEVAWNALLRRYDNKRLRLALKTLDRPVNSWDDWFIHLNVFKLDPDTREDWERSLEGAEVFPVFDQLVTFLEGRIQSLETAHNSQPSTDQPKASGSNTGQRAKAHKPISAHHLSATGEKQPSNSCPLCHGQHLLGSCSRFNGMGVEKHYKTADDLRLCRNCLRPQHEAANCPSSFRCRHCQQKHHSKLHRGTLSASDCLPSVNPSPTGLASTGNTGTPESPHVGSHFAAFGQPSILGTAQVLLLSANGEPFLFRALIDPGAEGSFVSELAVQALSLRKAPQRLRISGIGADIKTSQGATVQLCVSSVLEKSARVNVSAAVLPKLTELLPKMPLEQRIWPHLQDLTLADPNYHHPSGVDCILGADIYPAILRTGVRIGPADAPVAQETLFGWILTGPSRTNFEVRITACHARIDLGEQLRRFWEIEEVPNIDQHTPDEDFCERHFSQTHSRNADGRYVVRLPFSEIPVLPDSRSIAVACFLSLERRLQRSSSVKEAYCGFMREYEQLGHMRKASHEELQQPLACYLPHHAVFKQGGAKKIRVVFNASQKTGSAKALNDFLLSGPKLQKEITTIITRWRCLAFVYTADITKMIRQILVHQDDARWQRNFWRKTPDEPLHEYTLLTVTYGTACAPILSLRVLEQLAHDEQRVLPLGANVLRRHMYADDVLAGADTLRDAVSQRQQLINIFSSASMSLSKWAANHASRLLQPHDAQEDVALGEEECVSTLGLRWNSSSWCSFPSTKSLPPITHPFPELRLTGKPTVSGRAA